MATVLVVGVGTVGTFVTRTLAEVGAPCVAADCGADMTFFRRFGPRRPIDLVRADALDRRDLRSLLRMYQVGTIVLTAGCGSSHTINDPERCHEVQVEGTRRICEAASEARVKRIVFVSSFAVYGPSRTRLLAEAIPLRPATVYGRIKAQAEAVAASFRTEGLEVRIVRPCALYGPTPAGRNAQAARVIDTLLTHALLGHELLVDPGSFTGDEYLYVKDAGRGIALAALRDLTVGDTVFNLGSGKRSSPEELCTALQKVAPGCRLRLLSRPQRDGRTSIPPLDVTRIQTTLGFTPAYDLVAGLGDYAQEFQATS